MKRGTSSNFSEPIVRILLVSPHLYQVYLRNIYGYLKTILLDRCKKVGAQYHHFERSYFVDSAKLAELKKEFQDVLHMKNSDNHLKFKIEDFPMSIIKMILRPDKKIQSNDKSKNRIIFVDRSSRNRYFYVKKRIQDYYFNEKNLQDKNEGKVTLIITSEMNKKIWLSNILPNRKSQNPAENVLNQKIPQITELTYSELTSKRPSTLSSKTFTVTPNYQSNRIYIMTYDNFKFLENSWFLAEMKNVSMVIVDDAEFLLTNQSQISTLENKKRNFEAFRLLLRIYSTQNQLIFFISKFPQPLDLYKLLVLTKPKNFSGIKFSTSLNANIFNESVLTSEEKNMYDEFASWFKKRYRTQNKCFKEIYYLLTNVIVKTLDKSIFSRSKQLLPSLELNSFNSQSCKVTLIDSSSELVEKFKIMDKKYKKLYPSVNFKQILEDFHDPTKQEENRFLITSKLDDHLTNKHSKNYFEEAKELMLNSKIQAILRRLYFAINSQKERICIVLEDQKLEKRLKKYFKETQIEYIDYELCKENKQNFKVDLNSFTNNLNKQTFTQFDSNFLFKACIINIGKIYKQSSQLKRVRRDRVKKDFQNQFQFNEYPGENNFEGEKTFRIPKITTAQSIHFIDSFWNKFNYEKQVLLSQIFNFELSFIEESKTQNKINFKTVFKNARTIENYFLFDGSYEKMMLQKYLSRKQQIQSVKFEACSATENLLDNFVSNLISAQREKFLRLQCETIEYLDIDEEYDKVEEEAKRLKNSKDQQSMEQKVFLPKFTKPESKSFKQMLEEKLLTKNIDDILEESQEFEQLQYLKSPQTKQLYTKVHQNLSKKKDEQQKVQQKNQNDIKSQINQYYEREEFINEVMNESENQQLEIRNLLPEIQIQTIKLESYQTEKEISQIHSNILENYKEKDLFDQLLGSDFCYDFFDLQSDDKKHTEVQEVETQSEYEDEKNIEIKSIRQKQEKSYKADTDQFLQNFGYLAYHNIETQPPKRSLQLTNYPKQERKMNKMNKMNTIQQQDDSIEIIQTTPVRKFHKSEQLKNRKLERARSSRIQWQKSKRKTNYIPFYELPKEKRLCNKKLYQEAISKSKQLWQKKLRKEKELLILAPKKLQLTLRPMQGWRQNLTQEEIQKLKLKGIQL